VLITALLKVSATTLLEGGFSSRVSCIGTGEEATVGTCEELVAFLARQAEITHAQAAGGTLARGAANLTAQQRTILGLLAAGRTNDEIARDLGIAVGTVRQHVQRVYRRIGVRNRAEAVAFVLRSPPPESS
jgi:DNA-binding CsgD family transcriptional regulator